MSRKSFKKRRSCGLIFESSPAPPTSEAKLVSDSCNLTIPNSQFNRYAQQLRRKFEQNLRSWAGPVSFAFMYVRILKPPKPKALLISQQLNSTCLVESLCYPLRSSYRLAVMASSVPSSTVGWGGVLLLLRGWLGDS